jgi:hypothetical protein
MDRRFVGGVSFAFPELSITISDGPVEFSNSSIRISIPGALVDQLESLIDLQLSQRGLLPGRLRLSFSHARVPAFAKGFTF